MADVKKVDFKLDVIDNVNFDDLHSCFNDFVKPFDLSKAPLLRAKVINFTNNKHALFVDMHHIISDGTSLSIFINELCMLYNDEVLPELSITYKDFASFENENLNSGNLSEAENYWLNQFKENIPIHYFGIFDGHSGSICSEFLRNNLLQYISKNETHISKLTNSVFCKKLKTS